MTLKVLNQESLIQQAGEEQLFLYCDQDEFLQIAEFVERQVLQTEAVKKDQADASRYRWLRDISVPPHNFFLGVPVEFDGVKYLPHQVDDYIDAAKKR